MQTPGDTTYKKITFGYVTQQFDENGKPISQWFTAGDEIEYEIDGMDEIYSSLNIDLDYCHFDMVQPDDTLGAT